MENQDKEFNEEEETYRQLFKQLDNYEWLRFEFNKFEISVKNDLEYHKMSFGNFKGNLPVEHIVDKMRTDAKDGSIESKIEVFKKVLTRICDGYMQMSDLVDE